VLICRPGRISRLALTFPPGQISRLALTFRPGRISTRPPAVARKRRRRARPRASVRPRRHLVTARGRRASLRRPPGDLGVLGAPDPSPSSRSLSRHRLGSCAGCPARAVRRASRRWGRWESPPRRRCHRDLVRGHLAALPTAARSRSRPRERRVIPRPAECRCLKPCRPRTRRGRNSAVLWPGMRLPSGSRRCWRASRGCRPTWRPDCCKGRRCRSISSCTTRYGMRCGGASGTRLSARAGKREVVRIVHADGG